MKWDRLEKLIPYVEVGKDELHHSKVTVVREVPGAGLYAQQPGLYWRKTSPLGGDFLIEVTSSGVDWNHHQFTHTDLFEDLEKKSRRRRAYMQGTWAPALVRVVSEGEDPLRQLMGSVPPQMDGLPVGLLLEIAQCLALCEHRRYGRHEPLGGRCLPSRFALGIIFGVWSAAEAAAVEKDGKHGLSGLRKAKGINEPTFRNLLGGKRPSACAD